MPTQSRAQASKAARASALSQLDGLGTARAEFNTADMFTSAENSVASFIERVKSNIQGANMIVSGNIEDIQIETSETGIKVLGNAYLLFQDKGVNPTGKQLYNTPFSYRDKMPPAKSFENYIRTKNIQLRNEEALGGKPSPHEDLEGDDKAIKQAAYAMAMSVYKVKGIKPRNIFSKEIPQLVSELKKDIANFSASMITSGIKGGASGDVLKRSQNG